MSFDHEFTCHKNASRSHARTRRQHIVKRVNRLYKRSFALKGIEPRVSFLAVKQYQMKGVVFFVSFLSLFFSKPGHSYRTTFKTYVRDRYEAAWNVCTVVVSPTFYTQVVSMTNTARNASPPRARAVRPHSLYHSLILHFGIFGLVSVCYIRLHSF